MAIFALLGALLFALPQQGSDVIQLQPAVAAANLESKVAPAYPPLARAARVAGVVSLQLAISKDGQVSNLKVVRGHPLLNDAALMAVEQWRYKPYAPDQTPVAVTTSVTITFALIDPPRIPVGAAAITGRLRRADGTPAAGITVDVALPAGQSSPSTPTTTFTEVSGQYRLEVTAMGLLRAGSITDHSGEYRIERLGRGTYRVFAVVNQQAHYYPWTTADKAVLIAVDSNDTHVVGVDFEIP